MMYLRPLVQSILNVRRSDLFPLGFGKKVTFAVIASVTGQTDITDFVSRLTILAVKRQTLFGLF
jgi:hypothetical protein